MSQPLSPSKLYRLPWNLADNSISWLEPTSKCNLYCDGCYRENRQGSHKTLDEVQHELDVFEKISSYRRSIYSRRRTAHSSEYCRNSRNGPQKKDGKLSLIQMERYLRKIFSKD